MPATKDGRCWACVQRCRYVEGEVTWGEGSPRHLLDAHGPICERDKPGRRVDEQRRANQRKYQADYAKRNAEAISERRKFARHVLKHDIKRYGMRHADFEALRVAQGGRCACCWRDECTDVDHDHSTGEIRGLLCGPCNRMIGQAKEDPARLRAGIEYLKGAPPK